MNYKKILVPHDGSGMADVALNKAVNFAKAYGAEIILLRTVRPMHMPALGFVSGSDVDETKKNLRKSTIALKKEASTALDKKSKELSNKGIKVSKIVVVADDPVNEIIRKARSRRVNLIIMASRRLRGLAKLKGLGSVARKVSEHVKCPVLIVR